MEKEGIKQGDGWERSQERCSVPEKRGHGGECAHACVWVLISYLAMDDALVR